MKIFNEKNIGKLIILNSCLIGLLMWLGIVAHTLWVSQRNAKQDLLQLEENYISAKKTSVRLSVEDFIGRIDKRQQLAAEELRNTLQDRVEQIHNLAATLYQQNKDTMGREDLQQLIIEAIRPFRFNNDRGYFFIRSLAGIPMLCPHNPLSEGQSIQEDTTGNRVQVFDDMADIARNQGRGFNESLWHKSGGDKEQLFQRISYVSYFAPFDWYIGAGDYVDEVQYDIQEYVINFFNQSLTQVKSEYFFIYDVHNIEGGKDFAAMLVNPNRPDLLGKLLSDDYQDAKGKEFRKEMLAGLRQHGEVFVKYWYKKPGVAEPLPKMSYFKLYPEWNWIVARGFYFDDLVPQITAKKEQQQRFVKQQINDSLVILWFFLMGALLVSLLFSQKVRTLLQAYRLRLEKSNEDLKGAMAEAQAAAIVKGEFLANMSHEIRTPMNGIIGLSELALQTDLSPGQQDYLHKIHSSSLALLGILDGILDLSKIEAGKFTLDYKPFRLSEVLKELVDLFESAAQKKGLDFSIEQPRHIPANLVGDPLRLRQILVNLLGNAIKFTPHGKVEVKVVIKDRNDHCHVQFMVIDSGIGIAQGNIDHIFDSFIQADSSTSRRFGGTGLGLAISYNLVGLMGGSLEIHSQPGQGSTFSFTVKFAIAGDYCDIDANEQLSQSANEMSLIPDAGKIQLLLVEDNKINQQVAMEFLHKTGAEIELAETGIQALRRISGHEYDLIFMDIQMPEMNGLTACLIIRALEQGLDLPDEIEVGELSGQLRQRLQGRHMPIIAMTANVMVDDQQRYILAGMDGFIGKPFKSPELYAALRSQLDLTDLPPASDQLSATASHDTGNEVLLPDTFQGLHVKEGIARFEGNVELYLRLLQNFATDYVVVNDKLQETIAINQAEAIRIAHTVKGVAGSLGAQDLAESAALLEQDIRTARSTTASLQQFSGSLAEVIQAIKTILSEHYDSQIENPAVAPEDTETLNRHLVDLATMLAANDFQVTKQWQELKPLLGGMDNEVVEKLDQCINGYDFTGAQKLLAEIELLANS